MVNADIVIIGGGPAGLAAAVSAYDSGAENILILEREKELGGILRQCIHNGFGLHRFGEELTGPEYAQRDIDEVLKRNIRYQCSTMVIDVSDDKVITAVSEEHGFQRIKAQSIILAMGCRERPCGAIGIAGTRCAGIFSAGTAQRFVNLEGYMPGKEVVILGSGDIGLIMARRMTFEGAKVKACVELMPYSSGLKRNIVQCLDDYGIELKLSSTVVKIHGKERLEGVTVAKVDENRIPVKGTEEFIKCDTLLLSVGLIPENELSEKIGVKISPATSGAVVNDMLETNIEGVFACGNVLHVHDLVDFVSQESMKAGKSAAEYIMGRKNNNGTKIAVLQGKGVGGIVPQFIKNTDEKVSLMFRTDNVYKNASIVAESGGKEIYRKRYLILTPGEMVTAQIECGGCDDQILVRVEEK